jgi:hypothetical protein
MPYANVVFQELQALVAANVQQEATDISLSNNLNAWLEGLKVIMKYAPQRNSDHWFWSGTASLVDVGVVAQLGAVAAPCTLYGVLLGQNSADAEEDIICLSDLANTLADADQFAAMDTADDMVYYRLPVAATDGVREWHGLLFPEGVAFPTSIIAASEGNNGTATVANDVAIITVYVTL